LYHIRPIVTPPLPKREALENRRPFKEWLNFLEVPYVAENMDDLEVEEIRPIIDCHFCKHKICTYSSNEDYLGHLRKLLNDNETLKFRWNFMELKAVHMKSDYHENLLHKNEDSHRNLLREFFSSPTAFIACPTCG